MNDPILDLEARRLSVMYAQEFHDDSTEDLVLRAQTIYAFLSGGAA